MCMFITFSLSLLFVKWQCAATLTETEFRENEMNTIAADAFVTLVIRPSSDMLYELCMMNRFLLFM